MSNLIILANSIKMGGRCIAGIDPTTGQWKRPIPSSADSTIPLTPQIAAIGLLDIVDVPFNASKPNPPDEFQIENEYVTASNWQPVGKATVSQITPYVQNSGLVLHSATDSVDPMVLKKMPPSDWVSLQLIECEVFFVPTAKQGHWKGELKDSIGNSQRLKVTDPVAVHQLNNGVSLNGRCLLTISMGQAWQPPDNSKPLLCYKLISGVIKL